MKDYFTIKELTYSARAAAKGLDNTPSNLDLMRLIELRTKLLNPLREMYGKPITVTSGYRSAEVNKLAGGVPSSQHCRGEAVDITTCLGKGTDNALLFNMLRKNFEFDQLIWEFGDGNNPTWIHVSYSTYKRKQVLKSLKVNGLTKYVNM